MATNIEMNLLKDNGSYEVLYPKTDYNGLVNKPSIPDVSGFVTSSELNSSLSNYVPTYRTVNGKSLSSNISLTPKDLSFYSATTVGIRIFDNTVTVTQSISSFDIVHWNNLLLGLYFIVSGFNGVVQISGTNDAETDCLKVPGSMYNAPCFVTLVNYDGVFYNQGEVKNFFLSPTIYMKIGSSGSARLTIGQVVCYPF